MRAGLYESEEEIRRYKCLFDYKINKENLPAILEEMRKYKNNLSVFK